MSEGLSPGLPLTQQGRSQLSLWFSEGSGTGVW